MAYASTSDMVSRFGEAELLRATTPEDQPADAIDTARVTQALVDASGLIDSYLRRHYAVPLQQPTAEIVRATCFLARYDLQFGSQSTPNEQQRLGRKEIMDWLQAINDGRATLDGVLPESPRGTFARVSDRRPPLRSGCGGF